jgi:hypothetical protein
VRRPRSGDGLLGGLAVLLLLLAAALPASAEVRRFEVVGAVALDPAAPLPAPRQAALRAALQEAVSRASQDLVREASGKEAEPGASLAPPGEPTEYAVSYRIVEDRGEQAALVAGGPEGGREYVVVAEVQIDADRLRAALQRAGQLAADAAPAPEAASFRLEILALPSPAAWTVVRGALAAAGARSVIPLELEAGRVLLEVEAPAGPERLVDRLVHTALPEGLGLEALEPEAGVPRLRVRAGIPAIDTESPNRY